MPPDYKSERVRGVNYKYSPVWTTDLESEDHWRLYWQQQKIMQHKIHPKDRVLEIGMGSGFTANYLRLKNIEVTTFDIDPGKHPDIVANLVEYQFPEHYDHILAFQVFEHIPFEEFKAVIPKIAKACKKNVFLSIPRNEMTWLHLELRLPKIDKKEFRLTSLRGRVKEPLHFWEADDGSISRHLFETTLRDCGLTVQSMIKRFSRLYYSLSKG